MTIVMKQRVPAGLFKATCLRLLEEVRQQRKEILITKRGKPVARLVPVDRAVPEVFGRMAGTAETLGDIIHLDEPWDADQ